MQRTQKDNLKVLEPAQRTQKLQCKKSGAHAAYPEAQIVQHDGACTAETRKIRKRLSEAWIAYPEKRRFLEPVSVYPYLK